MNVILDVKGLTVKYKYKKSDHEIIKGIDFQLNAGKCLGILGESGSGKSMTVKAIMGLLSQHFKVNGNVVYRGENLLSNSDEDMRKIRGQKICMILQNPMTCFDPLYQIGDQMIETYRAHNSLSQRDMFEKSLEVLKKMQIREPEEVLKKYPHQLSSGMLQRIMIGIAISMKLDILIADEPTTALDSITQYEIMKVFMKIKKESDVAMIFISHDLSVIGQIADKVLVMHQGMIADEGTFEDILDHPKDAYTKLLVEKRKAVMEKYHKVLNGRSEIKHDSSERHQCEFSKRKSKKAIWKRTMPSSV